MRELSRARLESCVENLFERMAAMYGRLFADMWDGQDLANVKAAWEEDLSPFCWQQIAWALDQCKATRDFPPTLPMFLGLCRNAPRPEALNALFAPDVATESIQRVQEAAETAPKRSEPFAFAAQGKGWAHQLRARYLRGDTLWLQQIAMASGALREKWTGEGRARQCMPIEAEAA